jgi:3'-5' exonuclease
MLKSIFSKTAFIDLETVPDIALGRELYGISDEATDADVLQVAYEKHGATPDNRKPFLKPMFHKVIVSGIIFRSIEYVSQGVKEPTTRVKLEFLTLPTLVASDITKQATEKELIQRPLTFIGRNQAQVVGWNIDNFDWPVLIQRGLRNGVVIPDICKRPNKPWEGNDYYAKFSDARLDLMKVVAGEMSFGSNPKLSDTAIALGLPGKEGMDGSKVYDAWKEGRTGEIVRYCNHDCAMTYQIWLRVALMSGLLSLEQVEAEMEQLRQLMEGT